MLTNRVRQTPAIIIQKGEEPMSKFLTMLSISVFLMFSGFSVWAEHSDMGQSGMQSQDTIKNKKERGSAIDTQNPFQQVQGYGRAKGSPPGGSR
jgi:cytosine/uracil/thiamine/allantoin permease